eukprot:Opistho-1_new@108160
MSLRVVDVMDTLIAFLLHLGLQPSSEDEQWLADALSDCRRRPPTQSGEEFVSFTVNRLIFEQINAACEANINNMQTLLGLIGRDQTERSSTIERKRPDFWFSVKGVVIVKGEEKGSQHELLTAADEIVSKCRGLPVETYGSLDFYFAYAAAGSVVNFYLVRRGNGKSVVTAAITSLNVNHDRNRWAVANIVRNIIRLVPGMVSRMPASPVPLYSSIGRIEDGREVTIVDGVVVKRVDLSQRPINVKIVKSLYEAIGKSKRRGLPAVVKFPTKKKNVYSVALTPVGCITRPRSVAEFSAMIGDLVAALSFIHSKGFVHRDVRLSNVVYVPGKDGGAGEYVLIDFESADEVDKMPTTVLRTWNGVNIDPTSPFGAANDFRLLAHMCQACGAPKSLNKVLKELSDGKCPKTQ